MSRKQQFYDDDDLEDEWSDDDTYWDEEEAVEEAAKVTAPAKATRKAHRAAWAGHDDLRTTCNGFWIAATHRRRRQPALTVAAAAPWLPCPAARAPQARAQAGRRTSRSSRCFCPRAGASGSAAQTPWRQAAEGR